MGKRIPDLMGERKNEDEEIVEKRRLKNVIYDMENPDSILFDVMQLPNNLHEVLGKIGILKKIDGQEIKSDPELAKIFEEKMDDIIGRSDVDVNDRGLSLEAIEYSGEKIAEDSYAEHQAWYVKSVLAGGGSTKRVKKVIRIEKKYEKEDLIPAGHYCFSPRADNVLEQIVNNLELMKDPDLKSDINENFYDLLSQNFNGFYARFQLLRSEEERRRVTLEDLDRLKSVGEDKPETIKKLQDKISRCNTIINNCETTLNQHGKIVACLLLAGQRIKDSTDFEGLPK